MKAIILYATANNKHTVMNNDVHGLRERARKD